MRPFMTFYRFSAHYIIFYHITPRGLLSSSDFPRGLLLVPEKSRGLYRSAENTREKTFSAVLFVSVYAAGGERFSVFLLGLLSSF